MSEARTAELPSAVKGASSRRGSFTRRTLIIAGAVVLGFITIVLLVRRGGNDEQTAQAATTPAPQTATPAVTAAPTTQPTAIAVVTPVPINPQSIIVPQPFDLPAAIASAAPGATIKIPPGIYAGGIVLAKAIRLVGMPGVMIHSDGRECISVRAPGVFVQSVQFMCNGIGELPAISVADGADLELDGCRVLSMTALGVSLMGNGSLTALGTTFNTSNGVALRTGTGLTRLTQSTISDSKIGLTATGGGKVEMQSCAFDRNGGSDARGHVIFATAEQTMVSANDCHFTGNPGCIVLQDSAGLVATNCTFKNNSDASNANSWVGLVNVQRGAHAAFRNCIFEGNAQGITATNRGTVQVEESTFSRNGSQTGKLILATLPVSVMGQGSVASVRNTRFIDSTQFALYAINAGTLALDGVEVSGSRTAGIAVGDSASAPARAEIRGSRFTGNNTGMGVFAGSVVNVEDSEFRENDYGIIVGEGAAQLELRKTLVAANREYGLSVYGGSKVHAVECEFRGNARGVESGAQRKGSGKGSVVLEDCRFGGNTVFGTGARSQSELTLTRVSFEGGDKTTVFKERGAIVQAEATPSPTPGETPSDETSPSPEESDKPQASPAPKSKRPRPTPRPRRKAEDDATRILRRIFGPR